MPKAVVTFSPKEFGRKKILQPNPVENIAKQHKIKIIYADNISNDVFLNESKTIKEYVGIIASFGKIIPPNVLKIFSKGLINVHPSLLPKYRGPSPIQSSILNNDQETGATIFILDDKMDHGPIIGQMSLTLNIDDDYLSLSDKLAKLGSKLIINLVPKYLNGEITIKPQEESLASYSNKFVFENCKID
jgi:methionyl-tRNA formyltransferase